MNAVSIKVKALAHYDQSLGLPQLATKGSAGADVRACLIEKILVISPGERVLVPTGFSLEIPQGFEIQIRPRSGLSYKTSLMVINSPGTIDSDYRGELKILLGNLGSKPVTITHGDRVAQMIVSPVLSVHYEWTKKLTETIRGQEGFGSTGV